MCLAYLSPVPVLSFSIPKAGDYIDASAATLTGERINGIRLAKEDGFHFNGFFADKVQQVISVYYDDALIRSLVAALTEAFARTSNLPKFNRPVPMVLSGGTAPCRGVPGPFREAAVGAGFPGHGFRASGWRRARCIRRPRGLWFCGGSERSLDSSASRKPGLPPQKTVALALSWFIVGFWAVFSTYGLGLSMADQVLFLTELVGLKVFDLKGRRIGVVKDAALVPLVDSVRVDRYLISGGLTWLTVRHDQVKTISLDGIQLGDENLTPYHSDEYMLRMVRDLLDQQIIDAQGQKVVRVNDVTFETRQEQHGEILWVLEVDIGIRSVFRRLLQGVLPPGWVRRLQTRIPPHSIRWEFCNIPGTRSPSAGCGAQHLQPAAGEHMHPADLADIVEELGPAEREAIFETIDSEVAADALSEIDPDIQASILESLETEKAADIVEEMAPDQAADARWRSWRKRPARNSRRDAARAQDRKCAICSSSKKIPRAG